MKWLKWDKKDLFLRTQFRLTLYYSFIISVFLVVFVAIVYFILHQVVLSDEIEKLNDLADSEIQELQQSMSMSRQHGKMDHDKDMDVFLSENQLFYYVISTDGELLISNEAISPLQSLFLDIVSDWNVHDSEIKQETINVPTDIEEYRQFRDFDMRVLMLGRPITVNGETVANMYIGVDISYFNRIFKWVMIVFISLAALFIGVAVWLSNMMSKKALIPIKVAYNQQREFVANASHELRTPLSVIYSSIEALEMENEEPDAFTKKIMIGLKQEVKRMSKLITDLLTLARLDSEQEKSGLSKQRLDFFPQSELAYESFKKLAGMKGIDLQFHADNPLWVYADGDKLTQLLYILVDNAIKYTNSGGQVSVNLKTKQEKNYGHLIMTVSDTGVGMSKEDQQRIFDRFYRADKARTRKEGGYGLGLSIAKWIVDAHNGKIQVKSELGHGSVFEVTIPSRMVE
jgi:signal transduction histidine kinase